MEVTIDTSLMSYQTTYIHILTPKGVSFYYWKIFSDHTEDGTALEVADGYTVGHNGNRTPKKTTRGWKLCLKMKKDFTKCILLKDLKERNPLELSEYAVSNKIDHDTALSWWVPYNLRKQNWIISNQQKKYWWKNHTFGIEVTNSIKQAYDIDEETHTDFWRKTIAKKMLKVRIAYV